MHTRVKVQFKLKNLNNIIQHLNNCKDNEAVVSHEFEIELNKEAFKYLVKSDEVIDWDFAEINNQLQESRPVTNLYSQSQNEIDEDASRIVPIKSTPETEEVRIEIPDEYDIVPVRGPMKMSSVSYLSSWDDQKREIIRIVRTKFPEGLDGDNLIEILIYLADMRKRFLRSNDDELKEITVDNLRKYVLNLMSGNKYTSSTTDQVKSLITFVFEIDDFLDRLRKNWANIDTESASYIGIFEKIYNTRVTGIQR